MRNTHNHDEYNKYKSTTDGSNNDSGSGGGFGGPGCGGWIVIGIVVFFLISFISNGASGEAIETLLALGLIAYWLFKSL
ncbi:MAG: hypothetical protein IKD43_02540 [Clostridia bacterium]|nr:hypothetical protein [Clostridia bacterium]